MSGIEESLAQFQESTVVEGEKTLEWLQKAWNFGLGIFNVANIVESILLFIIGHFIVRFICRALKKVLHQLPIDPTLHAFVESAVRIILYFLLILMVANNLGIDITSLIALLSVAGLAVSLAIENSLSNLAGGVTILITKPFVKGDYIEIGGVSGTAQEIGLVYTKVLTVDNKVIQVPNKEVSSEKIINYTYQPERRIDMRITASYESPIEDVKNALMEAMVENTHCLSEPAPVTGLVNFGSSGIEYEVRMWIKTNDDYWAAYFELTEAIYRKFEKYNCEMTYDHLNVHLVDKGKQKTGM